MTARRGKSQARRNPDNGGLPGWAWGVLGLLLGVGLFLLGPKLLRSDGDGFFRPQPNPDAQPAPVAGGEDDAVATDGDAPIREGGKRAAKPDGEAGEKGAGEGPEFDFYTLLPGKEVPLSDAELAATERAESRQQAQAAAATPRATTGTAATTTTNPLPLPVATGGEPTPPTPRATATPPAKPPTATAATDTTRYLLQAGAFQASGQAEGLKARIALLGLGARVESASIGGKTVYRVRMGPYGSAGDLAEAKRKLASGGLPGMAIKVE